MIKALLKGYAKQIETAFDAYFPESGSEYKEVIEAMWYSFAAGGKRIRPALLLEFYKVCGGTGEGAVNFALALEMIHTYSLIHDDLPCMDNDDFRRGRPACHKAYGENLALLAGDALLTEGFSVAAHTKNIPAERTVRAILALSEAAGVHGMIGGQVIDIKNELGDPATETILQTYRLKTGALLRAAATIGCILAGADEKTVSAAEEYANCLGLAFQIIDDILDETGDEKLLGKPTGSDEKNNKVTYVTRVGLSAAKAKAEELTASALAALSAINGNTENLAALTAYLLERNY